MKKNSYKTDLRTAYDIGYAKGWDYAYDVPKRFGAKIAASMGFCKGVKNRYRSDKYIKKYNKYGGNK